MKVLIKTLALLALLGGCSEYGFHDDFRSYGEPTAISIKNDIIIDEFRSVYLDPVEILFVVDNSCSMADDAERLAEHLPTLGRELLELNINYRVGFTNTEQSDPGMLRPLPTGNGYRYWIDPRTNTKNDLFVYGATPGTDGWGSESGFVGIYGAAEVNNSHSFFRKNSSVHAIVLSDEADQAQYGNYSREVGSANKFIKWFNDFRDVNSFTIIGGEYFDTSTMSYGYQRKYNKAARNLNGHIINWDDDWDAFLINFANNIEFENEFRFYLSHVPADYKKIHITLCEDINNDGKCEPWDTGPDITHVYKYDKKGWSYSYDETSNSFLLDSPQREVQNYDYITAEYEISTGSPQPE